ncbi:MAG TPA: VWA domain-containing protein [Thermoanaerobaculia bacterium]|jgi:VWFA-related protein|nr:VWA domain-containing protein [Thermoanaerobaculia bacterium]
MNSFLPSRSRALLAAGFGALLLATGAAIAIAAAEPATSPAGAFKGSTEVNVVEVPVQVIRGGQPVRGLTAADFTVWAGKQQQQIVGFETIDVDALSTPAAGAAAAPAVNRLPSSARRHFLFLFDFSQSSPTSLERAQKAALQLLDRLSPADLAGVATFSPIKGPRVILGFTSDRAQIDLALRTLGSTELVETRRDWLGIVLGQQKADAHDLETQVAAREHGPGPGAKVLAAWEVLDDVRDLAPLEERANEAVQRDRARTFARGMSDLGTLLESVAGRKHVLLLSEGFASELLTGRLGAEPKVEEQDSDSVEGITRGDTEIRFGSGRLQNQLRALADAMKRADCVVHSIDIAGLQAEGRQISGGVSEIRDVGVERAGSGHDSLFYLAKETGGTFYRNYNDLAEAMSGVLKATAVTYVLTIQPGPIESKDGYVPLRVEVKGAGRGEVSARPGYYALAPPGVQQQTRERLRIAGEVLEGRAGGAVHTAALAVPLAGKTSGACAVVEVDGASLLEGHVGDMVSAEVTVYAFDKAGSIAAVARQLVGLDLRVVGDKLRASGFKLFAGLDLGPGEYELRALVRNTVSNRYGIAVAPLVLPPREGQPTLAGVFVEPPGRDWLLVRDSGAAQPLVYPFTLGDKVVVPAAAPRLHAGQSATLWVEAPSGAKGLEAVVKRADGGVASTSPLQLGERKPDAAAERLLATFSPAGLQPGGYTLEVRIAGTAGVASSVPFTVE